MSFYKLGADYNDRNYVLEDPQTEFDEFEARLQVATVNGFLDLRTSREAFDRMLDVLELAVNEAEPKPECDLDSGSFWVDKAPLAAGEEYQLVARSGSIEYAVAVSTDELQGVYDLMCSVHPDHETAEDNEMLEVDD